MLQTAECSGMDVRIGAGTGPATGPEVMQRSRVTEGLPFPLGATWAGLGVNFALFSAHATKVELCRVDLEGKRERSEERRVGRECRSRRWPYHQKRKATRRAWHGQTG